MIYGNLPKVPKVTHEGTITVGGITIRVMTLDNGQRIIPEDDFKKALKLGISEDDIKQILTTGQGGTK